ncbi:MAG: nicotinamide riboside transporter PnuC [Erysipelotrichaceae bacterium]|nr:nicotinamide riboside transporter PnuC [Erysipelotrichaceae bacterium]
MFKDLNRFEKGYIIIGLMINIIGAYYARSSWLAILNGIMSLFVGVYNAKGKLIVFLFTFIESITYIILSYQQKYYSEVFITLCIHMPIMVYSIINWFKNQSKKTDTIEIATLSNKRLFRIIGLQFVLSFVYYYFFKMLGNEMLLVSTINMVLTILALYFTAIMSEYSFICFLLGTLFKALLWIAPLLRGEFESFSVLIGTLLYAVIDFYGLYNWNRLKKEQRKDDI